MRMGLLRGLCVAMLCGAWAAAETLDEAIDRLAKAAAETRDLTVKYTVQGIETTPVRKRTMTGTMEFQMLRDGGKTLLRMAASLTAEEQGKEEGAPPVKREVKMLSVNDGEFMWTERPMGPDRAVGVEKALPRARQGLGLGDLSGPIEGAYAAAGLKGHFEVFQRGNDITLGAKGTIAGRRTTVFDVIRKQEGADKAPEPGRGGPPVRMVAELDDATGATLALKFINAAGEVARDQMAIEIKVNAGLDKTLFTYTPPEGMKVVDRTPPAEKSALPKPPEPEKKAP